MYPPFGIVVEVCMTTEVSKKLRAQLLGSDLSEEVRHLLEREFVARLVNVHGGYAATVAAYERWLAVPEFASEVNDIRARVAWEASVARAEWQTFTDVIDHAGRAYFILHLGEGASRSR
jgi:hypothetical protein